MALRIFLREQHIETRKSLGAYIEVACLLRRERGLAVEARCERIHDMLAQR